MNQDESWDQDIPKTDCQLQFMTPKQLLKIIDILKHQGVSTVKMQFGFVSDFQKKKFTELYKEEQNDEYQRDTGPKKDSVYTNLYIQKQRGELKKGCIFPIGSYLKSQIFLKAYEKQLKKLQNNCQIKIFQIGGDIYIESQKKIKLESVQFSQIMYMYKHMHVYIFYRDEELWNVVVNSEQFRKKLQKIGIFYHQRRSKVRNVAFYSLHFQPQQIKKQVIKQNSYKTKILGLYDPQLSWKDNMRIFDLVVKSIRNTIDKLRQIYQCNLQVNKSNSCFVLHLKNDVFQAEPVQEISRVVSNLFIISFPLRNSRNFINLLRRNSKNYPFINVNHYKNRAYCCVDRTKVQNKKDLLFIFNGFLEELNEKSTLTIHIKPNCVLIKNSKIPEKILDLTQQCKLEVQDYQKILLSQIFNIKVKTKFFREQKKADKQFQFSKFLLKLLVLKNQQKQITQQQLNQSLMNNTFIMQDNTDDTRQNKNSKKLKNVQQSKNTQEKTVGRGNRGNRGNKVSNDNQPKKVENKEVKNIKSQQKTVQKKYIEKQQQEEDWNISTQLTKQAKKQQNNNLKQSKMKIMQGSQLNYTYSKPVNLDSTQPYQKLKKERNKQLQKLLEQNFLVDNIKIYKLKINTKIFPLDQSDQNKINKQKCYCVQNIIENDQTKTNNLNFIKFSNIVSAKPAFIINMSDDGSIWIPTHIIQKF